MGAFITPDGQRYDMPGIEDPGSAMEAIKLHPVLKGNIPEGTRFTAGDNATPAPPAQEPTGFPVYDYPGDVKTAKTAARLGMEAGGQLLGGLGGAAVGTAIAPGPGTVAGGIAGETGGYAAGSKGADYLLGEDTGSWNRKLAEGAAFSVVPRGLIAGAEALGPKFVRSALKIPPTKVNAKTATNAVDTVISENMRVGEGGVAKGKDIIRESEKYLDDLLSKSKESVDVSKIVDAIDTMKKDPRFAYGSDPLAANDILDSVAEKVINHPTVSPSGTIPLAEAQKLKKGLYRELDKFYKNTRSLDPSKAILTNADMVGKATWAESVREEILAAPGIPKEAANVLARESNIINTMGWIKRRINVAAGMDPLTFNDVIVGGLLRQGWPATLAVRFLRLPAIQSQLGIWMAKSGAAQVPMQTGAIAAKNLLSQ